MATADWLYCSSGKDTRVLKVCNIVLFVTFCEKLQSVDALACYFFAVAIVKLGFTYRKGFFLLALDCSFSFLLWFYGFS